MKVGFFLTRQPALKVLGSLIDESLARGHETVLYYQVPEVRAADKAYQLIQPEKLSYFSQKGAQLAEVRDFSGILINQGLDLLFVLEGYHHHSTDRDHIEKLRNSGIKIVSIMHFFENCQWPIESLDLFDLTVYPSEYARDLHFDVQETQLGEKENRQHQYLIGGQPLFDQVENFSRAQAREKLGLGANQKMVLLFSPTMTATTPWRYFVWREGSTLARVKKALQAGKWGYLSDIAFGQTFADVTMAISQFCKRNEALFFVKTRLKHGDPEYLVAAADRHFDGTDEEYYPHFTSYQILAAADLCIAINSMAAPEAVAFGVPCINIYVPPVDFANPLNRQRVNYLNAVLDGSPGSLMNFDGCLANLDWREFPGWLSGKRLEEFSVSLERSEEYMQTFWGVSEMPACKRIFDACERIVAGSLLSSISLPA